MPYPAWLEIDRAQFVRNLQAAQRAIGDRELCVVMKADAYGMGIANLLPTVIAHQVSCIAIADNRELHAIMAHDHPRYRGEIMRIRSATAQEVMAAASYGITELVGHIAQARQISAQAQMMNITIAVHIELNSAGMGRNGLDLRHGDGREQALAILALPGLTVRGIMTHFPKEQREDIARSLARFQEECAWLIEAGGLDRAQVCCHAANSYALLSEPASHLDRVRVGELLYGEMALPNVVIGGSIMSFKTRIASINDYPAGSSVSYEREHVLARDSRVATVLVGYANGYRRAFSDRGVMLVRGQRAPVIGRVSMNVTTIDVSDIDEVALGDEVVIFGRQGQERITEAEIEAINQALMEDLYTVWGQCNPRVVI